MGGGGGRTTNKSQHIKFSPEKTILQQFLSGFELAAFRSRVRHPANKLSHLLSCLVQGRRKHPILFTLRFMSASKLLALGDLDGNDDTDEFI